MLFVFVVVVASSNLLFPLLLLVVCVLLYKFNNKLFLRWKKYATHSSVTGFSNSSAWLATMNSFYE